MTVYARWLAKKFWTLLAVTLILTAVVVQLGRLLAPMVAEHKLEITGYLSSELGLEIDVAELNFNWAGWRPELQFSQLVFTTSAGQQVVAVSSASAQIDLLASVRTGRIRMWQVELQGVNLSLAQDSEGGWNLSGFEGREKSATNSKSKGSKLADPLNAFLIGRYIHLQDIDVDFLLDSGESHRLELSNMLMQNQQGFHRVSANFKDAHKRKLLDFVFEGEGDPRDERTFVGRGYLEIDQLELQSNLALFSETLAALPELRGSQLSTRLWLSSSNKSRLALEGSLDITRAPENPSAALQAKRLPVHFNTQITSDWQRGHGWRLALQDAQLDWENISSPQLNIELLSAPGNDSLQFKLAELALEPWVVLAQAQPQVPAVLKGILSDLNPRGSLSNIQFDLPYANPLDFHLTANLQQVSTDPRHGVPGITLLDGYLDTGALAGSVDIDSDAGFSLFFPDVYHDVIRVNQAHGQVAWSLDKESNQVLVNSGLLELEGDVGRVSGYFLLDAPMRPKSRPTELTLQLGLQNSDVLQHKVLVPHLVPDSLLHWLDQALVSGEVSQAAFVMRGYFGIKNPAARSVQLGLHAQASELKFDPRWPALADFSGTIFLDDRDLNGYVDSGQLLDISVDNVGIFLQGDSPLGEGSLLSIEGHLAGPAADGLSLLVDTPLKEVLGKSFDAWELSGALDGEVELTIPLQANQPGQRQDVRIGLADSTLNMTDLNLVFEQLNGNLRYRSEAGLEASALSAQLWQQPLLASISSEPVVFDSGQSAFRTLIDFDGQVQMQSLANWLKRPELGFTDGDTQVTGLMTIPAPGEQQDYSALLQLNSNLEGVTVDLPGPYRKEAEAEGRLAVSVSLQTQRQFYEIDYGELVAVALVLAEGQLTQGLIQLRDPLADNDVAAGAAPKLGSITLPVKNLPETGLLIKGAVPSADAFAWLDVLERYGRYTDEYAKLSNEPSSASPLAMELDLQIAELQWDELSFEQLAVKGEAIEQGWALDVQHPVLAGDITWFEDKPLAIDLEYLHWPLEEPLDGDSLTASGEGQTLEDPLAAIDPRSLVALDFKAQEVKLGDADFGRWSFQLRPEEQGVRVSQLQADIRGAKVGAKPGSESAGAEFTWHRNAKGDRSHFSGMVSSTDLVTVMESWGQQKAIETKRARLLSDLSWVGSPAAMTLPGLQGDVVMDVEKGRFFQNTGQASSALLRLFGLFNFDSWARRLRLDFSDLYKGGMAFDSIDGRLSFAEGNIFLIEPVAVDTPSASLQMGGQIGLRDETLNTSMVATLPVGGNATLIAAFAAGLPIAAGVYAVSKLFKRQVDKVASVSYEMSGSWADPSVKFNKLFDNKSARKAAEGVRKASDEAKQRDAAASAPGSGKAADFPPQPVLVPNE